MVGIIPIIVVEVGAEGGEVEEVEGGDITIKISRIKKQFISRLNLSYVSSLWVVRAVEMERNAGSLIIYCFIDRDGMICLVLVFLIIWLSPLLFPPSKVIFKLKWWPNGV